MTSPRTILWAALCLSAGSPLAFPSQKAVPWRLSDTLESPDWFEISGSVDVRYESLDRRFKSGESGENHGTFTRALVAMTLRDTYLEATAEVIDARALGVPDDARLTTNEVDTLDLLQGYVAARFTDAFEPGDKLRVQLGRHTMDVGSRRLVARNIFRNTINAFTGLNAQWESANGVEARAFYTYPVQRLPGNGDPDALRDGDTRFNAEPPSIRFWGLVGDAPQGPLGSTVQGYLLGLNERDSLDFATANRQLVTVGGRLNKDPEPETVHWELESALQFGKSRKSASSTESLDHEAFLHHLTVGYMLPGETKLRVEGVFDWASGDSDPNDGKNERFDSLYGIPRQDFGPTGIFREIARANLISPGVRVWLEPADRWSLMALYREEYLASDRDAWTTTDIQDPTGNSGDHIGALSEIRFRYELAPKSSLLEFGVAYHSAGSFAKRASTGNGGRDALYGYVQTTFWF
ncbi:hypothetical protein Poly30_47710 [Planctomycetes bacterium Poly30]|uniref:Alginate export domain-containing protein n=1 Tax=Saltatorellus ferox TaxID=2528018 RepID=A0A518EYT2_9BACT|nr:hypothetical protein Poly30_47710 [Planctomycetes bacterium Poly30]